MKTQNDLSKSRKNYYIDIAAFLPFVLLLFTGIIMLLYHAGKPFSETIYNKDGNFWLKTHIIFAVITFIMITIHLSSHLDWFKKLFSGKQKKRYWIRNLIFVILFLATALTSVFPWLILDESKTTNMILGLHNKIGLLTIAFFILHIISYFKWLINMTKKIFGNKRASINIDKQ